MRRGLICLALALGGFACGATAIAADRAAADSAAVAGPDRAAVAGPDSAVVARPDSAAVAGPDSAGVARPDTAAVARPDTTAVARPDTAVVVGVDSAMVAAAAPPPGRLPWTGLVVPSDPLVLHRNEVERTGAHLPLELLALLPGTHALEASGTVPFGAVTHSGSFAGPELSADGWPVRLPRLEGRDLSRLLLDRLGPGPTLVPLASPGEVRVADRFGSGSSPAVRWFPSEPVTDSSQSRIAIYHGGTAMTGGGLVFSDRRGPMGYGFGLDNSGARPSGSVAGVSTRLAMIDASGVTSWGRIGASLRGTEAAIDWKNGRRLKHDDQGAAVEALSGDTLGSAWSLRFAVLDDRLSGSEFFGREFRRKGARLEAGWQRGESPVGESRAAWVRLAGERDWFAVRFPGGVFAPRVNRGQVEAGARLGGEAGDGGEGRGSKLGPLHLGLVLRASDRHPPRPGGNAELEVRLPMALTIGVGGSRVHRPPTFDQEVLVRGRPTADPEQQDAAVMWFRRDGHLDLGLLVARRRLEDQPVITKESAERPWPEFEFGAGAAEHWEVRAGVSTPRGPLGLEAGAWGSRFAQVSGQLPAFAPEALARAFVTLRFDLVGGDLVLRPRVDGLLVGESSDFSGRRLGGHARLDATVVAIVGEKVDLELRLRNALDRRYPLAVVDPATDQLELDSGRVTLVGLRWRLAN